MCTLSSLPISITGVYVHVPINRNTRIYPQLTQTQPPSTVFKYFCMNQSHVIDTTYIALCVVIQDLLYRNHQNPHGFTNPSRGCQIK